MNKLHHRLLPVLILGSASILLQDAVLLAQESGGLDEIIVTARKRDESLMDVPLAITAFPAAAIEAMDLQQINDLQLYTPSLSFTNMQGGSGRNDRSSNALVFRGLSLSANTGITAGGQVFIDGAPVVGGLTPSFVDVERVEILKGPQSAHFGRSTFVGAINFIMKEPGEEFGATVGLEYSPTFDSHEQNISVEGPIGDKFGYRVSVRNWEQGGYIDNYANTSVKLGERTTESISTSLVWRPTENLKIKGFFNYFKDEDGPGAQFFMGDTDGFERAYPDGTCDPLSAPMRPGFEGRENERWALGSVCGTLPSMGELDPSIYSMDETLLNNALLTDTLFNPDPNWVIFDPNYHRKHGLKREAYTANIRIDWDIGDYTFTSQTAFHEDKIQNILDLNYRDGRPVPNPLGFLPTTLEWWNTTLLNQGEQEDFSQEFRLTSPQDGRFRWTAGLNYFDAHSPGGTVYGNLIFGPFFTSAIVQRDVSTPAVFGAAYYDFTDKLTLTVEGRYQEDKITEQIIIGVNQLPPDPPETLEATYKSFSPRISLDYKYADNSTAYILFSRGYRPGRFNGVLNNAPQDVLDALLAVAPDASVQVDEEQLDNYEFGIKSTWLDGRARTTLAVYYDEWIDGQVSNSIAFSNGGVANLISITLNNGKATLTGAEFEGQWAATDRFILMGSLGYNKTEIDEYVCGDCNLVYGSFEGVEGNHLPSTPELAYSLGGQYTHELSTNWEWYGRFDWAHQGSRYQDYSNVTKTAAYDNLNLRLGFTNENLMIEAFVLNALDNDEFNQATLGIDLFTFTGFGGPDKNASRLSAPRPTEYGVRATYRF
jgi:iron complex outermembrane receptor protein